MGIMGRTPQTRFDPTVIQGEIDAISQKKIKSTYFATITSGTTTGTISKPAGGGADVSFVMDEWGTATDALLSTIENGKPTFVSPVTAGGVTITATFNTAGEYTFSGTPSPAADIALIYVYICNLENYDYTEVLFESELVSGITDHGELQGLTDLADHPQYNYSVVGKNGFPFNSSSDYTLTFVNGTRTFSITPTGANFKYWAESIEYTKTTAQSVIIDDTEGLHFIYFDGDTLTSTTTFSDDLYTSHAYVAFIYWDATNDAQIALGHEYHSFNMMSANHLLHHFTEGAQLESGGSLGDILVDQSGDADTHAQFSVATSVLWDEDIKHTLTARASDSNIPVYYRSGADASNIWRMNEAASFPVLTTGTGRATWNELTGGNWQLTEVTNTDFVLAHIFAYNDRTRKFGVIMGQNTYNTLGNARDGALVEVNALVLSGIPFQEIKFLGTIILQTNDGYTNTVASRIRSTDTGDDYIDLRSFIFSAGGESGAVVDHSDLAGLQGGTPGEFYHLTSAEHTEVTGFFDGTDITDAEAETLTDGSDADSLHSHGTSVVAASTLTDNALVRGDGGSRGVQTSTVLVSDAGEMTNPSQPMVLEQLSGTQSDVTGDGTAFILTGAIWTEIVDQGNNSSNGTFTAPITGKYQVNFSMNYGGITSSHDYSYVQIVTSNRIYYKYYNPYLSAAYNGFGSYGISMTVDMDLNDTLTVGFGVDRGAKVVDLTADTFVSIALLT